MNHIQTYVLPMNTNRSEILDVIKDILNHTTDSKKRARNAAARIPSHSKEKSLVSGV